VEAKCSEGRRGSVDHSAFSPDETLIAVADDDLIRVGRVDTGQQIRAFGGHEYITELAFSPDGKVLVVQDR
jgi:WD40 repeat protein